MTTDLRLAEITPDNFETALAIKVRADQEHLVEPVVQSLAEASLWPGVAWPRLILDGDKPVGFLMAFLDIDWLGDGSRSDIRSGLWRLNIDGEAQAKGYGRFAVEQVAEEIRRRGGKVMTVTYHPGADGPQGFYLRLGFKETGETSGDQAVAELAL